MDRFLFIPPHHSIVPVSVIGHPATLEVGQTVKIMTWNIQFCAGKDYVFFYDLDNMGGPDERPSPLSIRRTMDGIAAIIRDERPDIVLFQEVDHGARRTGYHDQFGLLIPDLGFGDACHAEAFYWRAAFIPHARIMGAVGMKMVTLSRYAMTHANRLQLPRMTRPWYESPFYLRHCLLSVELPLSDGGTFTVLNTHLEAFPAGTDIMAKQIDVVGSVVDDLTEHDRTWCLGGDFNLLPAGEAGRRSAEHQHSMYVASSEMARVSDRYETIPGSDDTAGPNAERWFTHFPNDPAVPRPDRTIDYLVLSPRLERLSGSVRQVDTMELSDHFPVIAEFRLPTIDHAMPLGEDLEETK